MEHRAVPHRLLLRVRLLRVAQQRRQLEARLPQRAVPLHRADNGAQAALAAEADVAALNSLRNTKRSARRTRPAKTARLRIVCPRECPAS